MYNLSSGADLIGVMPDGYLYGNCDVPIVCYVTDTANDILQVLANVSRIPKYFCVLIYIIFVRMFCRKYNVV